MTRIRDSILFSNQQADVVEGPVVKFHRDVLKEVL